jgi:hypothetical protein
MAKSNAAWMIVRLVVAAGLAAALLWGIFSGSGEDPTDRDPVVIRLLQKASIEARQIYDPQEITYVRREFLGVICAAGDFDRAEQMVQQESVEFRPGLKAVVAREHALAGHFDKAAEIAGTISPNDLADGVWTKIAREAAKAGRHQAALRAVEWIKNKQTGRKTQAFVSAVHAGLTEGHDPLVTSRAAPPDSLAATLSELYARRGDYDDALQITQQGLAVDLKVRVWLEAALWAHRRGDPNTGGRFLDRVAGELARHSTSRQADANTLRGEFARTCALMGRDKPARLNIDLLLAADANDPIGSRAEASLVAAMMAAGMQEQALQRAVTEDGVLRPIVGPAAVEYYARRREGAKAGKLIERAADSYARATLYIQAARWVLEGTLPVAPPWAHSGENRQSPTKE